MTSRATHREPDEKLPTHRLLVVLAPFVVLVSFCALLALGAALAGFHREEMMLIASGAGAALALPALFLLYHQVADRSAAQLRLREVEARVGGIVESAMDAIISVDEEQRVVQFNAAAERVFRWPRATVVGQPLDMLIPERFRAIHRGHVVRFGHTAVTSRGMGQQAVLNGLRASGEEFPVEASISQHVEKGRKLFTVILRDMTERVRSEERLARSEARLRGILDSAMDAIITVDESQHVVLFNKAAEQVFGYRREQAIGFPLDRFIPERFRASHARELHSFGQGGMASRRMGEERIVVGLRRSGEEFPIDASISQVGEHGQRLFTVILRDVTERVRSQAALQASREENRDLALAAQNLREQEKSRVARELHDELGQALTALKIDVAWMRARAGAADPAMQAKLSSMQLLLDDTVAATRRIAADLRPLVLDDLGLAAAAEWLTQNFTRRTGIPCELGVQAGFEEVPDPCATTIFRVLQEALTNVAKHAEASRVEVTLALDGDQIALTVRDDGRGFAVREPRKPASFGLPGLRERAQLLRGEIAIESSPGHGTIVEMRLPKPDPGAAP